MSLELNIKFNINKKKYLEKIIYSDKSKKGSIDLRINELVNEINLNKKIFTTSSCSGRIRLIGLNKQIKKNKIDWIFTSHELINVNLKDEINNKLKIIKTIINPKDEYWFIQESAILHCCIKDIDTAHRILIIARESGFKKSGIISIKNRIIVELINTNKMETIIAKKNVILIDLKYMNELIKVANRKLKFNFEKIELFTKKIKEFNKLNGKVIIKPRQNLIKNK